MIKEDILKIWINTEPTAKSPYALYGYPPMWETFKDGNRVMFTRPGKTMVRDAPFMPYREDDGVHYQWQEDGEWIDQGYQAPFDYFFDRIISELENTNAK